MAADGIQPGARHAPDFLGRPAVWRTWAFGAGTPGAAPQDKNPDIAFYEANCPEFVVSGADPAAATTSRSAGRRAPSSR